MIPAKVPAKVPAKPCKTLQKSKYDRTLFKRRPIFMFSIKLFSDVSVSGNNAGSVF